MTSSVRFRYQLLVTQLELTGVISLDKVHEL